jgi:hypothetical protein
MQSPTSEPVSVTASQSAMLGLCGELSSHFGVIGWKRAADPPPPLLLHMLPLTHYPIIEPH